jgi:hypothetical protein
MYLQVALFYLAHARQTTDSVSSSTDASQVVLQIFGNTLIKAQSNPTNFGRIGRRMTDTEH